jgi:predicted Zn-dependent protease|tara:strand:+ start:897 stop:1718 length:822 start_codon:yes stop_codon:yes gene_type:complete
MLEYTTFVNQNRRAFLKKLGCSCCAPFLLSSCTQVAITDRMQLSIYPESVINQKAYSAYQNIKKDSKLSKNKLFNRQLNSVGIRITKAVELYFLSLGKPELINDFDWEFILIEDDTLNAWCMPGGKIAFYTGILQITKNEDGMAAVMGHEIAHAVAKHSVERASQALLLNVGTTILDNVLDGALRASRVDDYFIQLGINLPFGRLQESEADYLGLIFMTLAGYDNTAAIGVWERMEEASKSRTPPEFLSTHPTPGNRIKKIQNWIPEINEKYT